MSKMISQYLILEAIKNGEVTWETQIPVVNLSSPIEEL